VVTFDLKSNDKKIQKYQERQAATKNQMKKKSSCQTIDDCKDYFQP